MAISTVDNEIILSIKTFYHDYSQFLLKTICLTYKIKQMAELPIKPYRESRPWGGYEKFTENMNSTVKILTINPGQAFSLQRHAHRDEFWHILSGSGTIIIGEQSIPIKSGEDHFIPRLTDHRALASEEAVVILEISLGQFDEVDITRLEDKYGRA